MYRSPFRNSSRQTTPFKKAGSWKCGHHTGVDRVCDTDKTIVAISDGVILRVNDCGTSYGYHVVYRTDDDISVLCAHLAKSPSVKVNQRIKSGQQIGIMGNTGNSSGAHLHIELQKSPYYSYAKNLLDPNKYIDWYDFKSKNEEDNMKTTWKNGSTPEKVFSNTKLCKEQSKCIDTISSRATANCTAVVDGCYLINYLKNGVNYCGFVKYHGGIKGEI